MKIFFLTMALISAFCAVVLAQANQTTACPAISVTGGGVISDAGRPMTFTANIEGSDLKTISYQWSVSNGIIMAGQGTPTITVDLMAMPDSKVTATVQIDGLPNGCSNKAAETGSLKRTGDPIQFDRYEKIPFRQEKVKLDAVDAELEKKQRIDGIVHYLCDEE